MTGNLSSVLASIEIALAAFVLTALVFVTAPYGRHVRSGWGPVLPARWAWMVMEFPAFGMIAAVAALNASSFGSAALVLLALWESHYIYRTFIYPFLLTSPRKPFPLLLVAFALAFNVLNGLANGLWLAGAAGGLQWDPRLVAGIAVFVAGFTIHAASDRHLRALRKSGGGEYAIPTAGLFRFVSSPNYLGEILEWCGWAIAAWSPAALAFALFTFANLAPRAAANHRWYRQTFAAYPRQRKALIPWVL